MLIELEIENLALFRAARVRFAVGLNALTGETGAGKTLVLRALDLVRGGRADRSHVREGTDACSVSALFRIPELLQPVLGELIAPISLEEGHLLVRRVIHREGSGRVYLNGKLAPLSTLKAVGQRLVDGVGQGEARLLADRSHRTRLVDLYGALLPRRDRYLAARDRALASRRRRDTLLAEVKERRRRLSFLRFELDEIRDAAPEPGEAEQLRDELGVLEAADQLRELCGDALQEVYEADGSVVEQLGRFDRRIQELPDEARRLLAPAGSALAGALREIDELVASLRLALDQISTDPARSEVVGARLDLLRHLLDRFGPGEAELFAHRSEVEDEISRLEQEESDTEGSEAELAEACADLERAGARLEQGRGKAARQLAAEVQGHLRSLGMRSAAFDIVLEQNPGEDLLERAGPHGLSSVEFLLAANRGHAAQPMATVASGGETARIALALRMALADSLESPVLLFDEVEAGVGARLGERVGRALQSIGARRQVIVVTHLPQVAAFAEMHLRASKGVRGGATEARLEPLKGRAREDEIAAMMRGRTAAASTRDEARSLLDEAGSEG